MKTLTVIDTFGFFFRSFFALPPLKSKNGFPTGLLTGFTNLIHQLETNYETDYLVFALDAKGKSFRNEIDPNYKANRPEAPPELKQQLPVAIEWINKMGFINLSKEGFEADDVIASLVRCAREQNIRVRVVSHDKDLYQLIDDGKVFLFDPIKKSEINTEACLKKFGVKPEYFIQYQSLVGDSSDNVPGVKGIGAKTAEKLINEYQTLERIYDNIDSVTPPRVQNLLKEGKENAFLSRQLVSLRDDVFDSCDLETYHMPEANPLIKITSELMDLDMHRVLDKVKKNGVIPEKKKQEEAFAFETVLLDTDDKLFAVIDSIPSESIVAFDTETDSLDTKSAKMVGFSFSWESSKGYYIPVGHSYLGVGDQVSLKSAQKAIELLLAKKLIGQNLKFDLGLLYQLFAFDEIEPYQDTMILAWLLNPESSVGLDSLMKRHFSHEMISFKDTVKKGENFSSVPIEEACKYAGEDAVATRVLLDKLLELFKTHSCETLLDVAKEVELPFINTLISMEKLGIRIDVDFFEKLGAETDSKLMELTQGIHADAGVEFNINSTQQLGKVLFETLGLKTGKKTKTGYSTNESVLQKLVNDHEIIPKILEYRELYKLKSTYILPLMEYASKDEEKRIYTSFLHTGTATGRLSSKNPNLQNIPVKTELGREIRKGFIAKEGHKLISIDYSQIELRLLAHFSQDKALVDAYLGDKDIHMETAVKIFGEEEAKTKRNIAKSINFGLIYGMGARRLAETVGISQNDAKGYIESYFASFPTVKNFLSELETKIEERGYTETLLGRRRYFDFESAVAYQKAGYLREGVNTVFQGSAADLIKMSMNKIHHFLKSKPAEMLLQVHDELIFEAQEKQAESLSKELAQIMENIYELRVPLQCGVSIGNNWGELK